MAERGQNKAKAKAQPRFGFGTQGCGNLAVIWGIAQVFEGLEGLLGNPKWANRESACVLADTRAAKRAEFITDLKARHVRATMQAMV